MDRRRFVAATMCGIGSGFAGCIGFDSPVAHDEPTASPGPSTITGADGKPSNICERDPLPARIPAITDPAFASDWSGIDRAAGLNDSVTVIGIQRAGKARAYPISVLRFEIVNDRFDEPVLVTYCPLCNSGLTALRRVNGQETVFANTSYTWRPPGPAGRSAIDDGRVFGLGRRDEVTATNDRNLVMFDRATGSYWSQLLGQAICGPLTGEPLTLIPSTVTDWANWRDRHPQTSVLLPPPHSNTIIG